MKKIATLLSCLFTISGFAQNISKYSYYFNSISLEFAAPLNYVEDVVRTRQANKSYTVILFPAAYLNYEGRIKNKFYGEGGFSYGNRINGFSFSNDTFHYADYNFYGGLVFKQKIFKNFYFTPSFDIYYTARISFNNDSLYDRTKYLTVGPTLGFEYFISKRISFSTDLLNINWGLRFHNDQYHNSNVSFLSTHNLFTLYKVLSFGIHYNFGWKKKQKNTQEK